MNEAQAAAQQYAETRFPHVKNHVILNGERFKSHIAEAYLAALSWTPIQPGEVPELPRHDMASIHSVDVPMAYTFKGRNGVTIGYFNYKSKQWEVYDIFEPAAVCTHYFTGFIGNLPGKEGDNGT